MRIQRRNPSDSHGSQAATFEKVRRKRLDVGMGKDETHLGDLPWYPSMDWRGKSTGNFAGGIPLKMVVYH